MNWIAKLSAEPMIGDQKKIAPESTKCGAPKPLKPSSAIRVNFARVEAILKPCPLCNGSEFVHGNKGGYFCKDCQPGHEGALIKAGSKRLVTNLKRHVPDWNTPEDNHSNLGRKSREKHPPSFLTAHRWISQHRFKLLGFGWTPPELYRRNKSKGIAWLRIWDKPDLQVSLGRSGEVVFHFATTTGKKIQQTAFPRRVPAWK